MRRLYKIILILLICSILTFIIYKITQNNSISYLALGDGIASGETAYNIDGISFNNYFEENEKNIKEYNDYFAKKNNTISDLITDIKSNTKYRKVHLKQLIHNADIVTLALGMDELVKYSITDKITEEYLKDYFYMYDELLKNIRNLTENKIIVLSMFKTSNISQGNIIIINSMLSNLADKYNCKFINITSLLKNDEYFLKNDSYYFSYKAHYKIYQMISYTLKETTN